MFRFSIDVRENIKFLTCSSPSTHVDNAVTIIKGKGYTEITLFKTCGNLQHGEQLRYSITDQ